METMPTGDDDSDTTSATSLYPWQNPVDIRNNIDISSSSRGPLAQEDTSAVDTILSQPGRVVSIDFDSDAAAGDVTFGKSYISVEEDKNNVIGNRSSSDNVIDGYSGNESIET